MKFPRVFIGSAKESLKVAQKVKNLLSSTCEVFIWTDDIFKSNESPLQTLLTEACLFDFGIMILSSDDHTTSRGEGFETARANTLFEFGLFLGRLGEGRSFALAEDGIRLPSDLSGVTIERYKKRARSTSHYSVNECIRRISNLINESWTCGFLGMLPSTVLAIGYFNNFVKDVAEGIASKVEQNIGNERVTLTRLYIVFPKELVEDMKKRATAYYSSKKLKQLQFQTKHRTRPLFILTDTNKKEVNAFDLPTTLEGLNKAINMYLRGGHIGKSSRQKLLECHELSNFRRVLELLIQEDSFARQFVQVIDEDK